MNTDRQRRTDKSWLGHKECGWRLVRGGTCKFFRRSTLCLSCSTCKCLEIWTLRAAMTKVRRTLGLPETRFSRPKQLSYLERISGGSKVRPRGKESFQRVSECLGSGRGVFGPVFHRSVHVDPIGSLGPRTKIFSRSLPHASSVDDVFAVSAPCSRQSSSRTDPLSPQRD
jgi:hypothetical protein